MAGGEERGGGGDARKGAGGMGEGCVWGRVGRVAVAEGADDGVGAAVLGLHLRQTARM